MISEEMVVTLKKWIIDMKGSLAEINLNSKAIENLEDMNGLKAQIASLTAGQEQLKGELSKAKENLKEVTYKE